MARDRSFRVKEVRVCNEWSGPRRVQRNLAFRLLSVATLFILCLLLQPLPAAAQAVRGQLSAVVDNGFARLVFLLDEEVDAQVRVANNILTISFARPVDVVVDRIGASAPGYISVARRDPDGRAVRIALSRKVTMNSMA